MTQEQLIVQNRKSLLICAQRQGISQACKTFNVSRTTFYKIKKQYIQTGSLTPKKRRKPRMPNETRLSKKKIILDLVQKQPGWGLGQYVRELRKHGIVLDPATLWHCLKRFGLNRKYLRLLYVEQLRMNNQPMTERTVRQLKRTLKNDIKRGHWPGHVIALDTFYVGNIKGIGRIYQQTGIDLCSRFGWAHLYTSKEQTSSCHFVESVLLPKFYHNNIAFESVLTDNGSEFTARSFQQLLADYDILHHRIPKGKPMCNGYCERFQRTILDELYRPIFIRKFFTSLEELQKELNEYLVFYNFERAHFGLSKHGVSPIEVFTEKNSFLRQRFKELLT